MLFSKWTFINCCSELHVVHVGGVIKPKACKSSFGENYISTPFKKSNATPLWSIILICLWVYIHHVRYHLKAYLSFHWYFIWHDCFAGTCAGRLNWVQCQKINVAKLDHNFNRWHQFVYEIIFIVLGFI